MSAKSRIPEILDAHQKELLDNWLEEQNKAISKRTETFGLLQPEKQSSEFLNLLRTAMHAGEGIDLDTAAWEPVKEFLNRFSFTRAERGFSPSETAVFVFCFKKPLFSVLRRVYAQDVASLAEETWYATELFDNLGLYTTEVYQKSRNAIISRQQQEILELSTPVVRLWTGILALPLIGILDSVRTQVVMENLLKSLVDTGSSIAIIDITGVPTVDTLVAQHLLKTVAAARLMGADCYISGIRPQIAQTIVHLGVSLPDVVTKATLADAFGTALRTLGFTLERTGAEQ